MKVIIIGGGISGLAAGIYARRSGFETVILEKTVNLGGECTGWIRKGFHIDNCIHWLTGTKKNTPLYKVWCQVGALGPEINTIPIEPFFHFDTPSGRTFTLHRDLEALRNEMYLFGPDDKKVIDEFISIIKGYQKMEFPAEIAAELASFGQKLKAFWNLRGVIIPHVKYRKATIADFAAKFKSKDLQAVINAYFPRGFYAEALFDILAIITCGNGDLPEGGSLALSDRMAALYILLGGQVRTKAEVNKIEVVDDGGGNGKQRAKAVILKDGERVEADYIISTCPVNVLLHDLLDRNFKDSFFDERLEKAPTFSNAVVYMGVKGDSKDIPDNSIVKVEPFKVCRRRHRHILFHHYGHEKDFAPAGHYVCQLMVTQYDADFKFWKSLWDNDPASYKAEKKRLAASMLDKIIQRFPVLKGCTDILEVITPLSFHKRCGSHHGSYMCFIRTPYFGEKTHSGYISGLDRLYAGGQWGQSGGMPAAVTSGRFAVQRLCHDAKVKFIED